uniref:Uncharacterized protein n=1 Tax=Anguilla anguilla TaxID=7936 RepID=A0A0E9UU16_ANGAN
MNTACLYVKHHNDNKKMKRTERICPTL